MEAMSGTDIAIGWGLIVAASLAFYYGIPFLIATLVRGLAASAQQDRLRRERIQEDLDEQLRVEMLAWAEQEHEKSTARAGRLTE
jgi:CRISPR/Cas system CMR subunit Cmr6 (Cas7 group RAMP superfamily)